MTKLVICVKSCQAHKDRGDHDIIRATWGQAAKALDIDVRFFVGKNFSKYESDETHVDCPDDKNNLPFKVREICKWASGKLIDYIFLCDNDTFLAPKRLLACGFERYDYAGKIDGICKVGEVAPYKDCEGNLIPECHPFASGGLGYFLSKRALSYVANIYPTSWAEDLGVGQIMGALIRKGELTGYNIPNFRNTISWHFLKSSGNGYDPKNGWQEALHKANN